MNVKKFKRKLKKTPGGNNFMVFLYLCMIVVSVVCLINFTDTLAKIISGVMIAAFVWMTVSGIKKSINLRKKGKTTIEFLESRNLLEAAAAEYATADKVECRCTHRNGDTVHFSSRKNALTPNFIYVMTENNVLVYDDITKAYIIEYTYRRRQGRHRYITLTNHVFTLFTNYGEAVDLMNIDQGKYSQKQTETLDKIAFILKTKRPDCVISQEVVEKRDHNGQESHYE